MKKFFLILSIFLIIGCKRGNQFYLEDKYYGNTSFTESTSSDVNKLIEQKESFILYTYNNYCILKVPCEDIFREYIQNAGIGIVKIPYEEYKKTTVYKKVRLSPTVIIINKGKVVSYLDVNSNKDLDKYQDVNAFSSWISEYVLEK